MTQIPPNDPEDDKTKLVNSGQSVPTAADGDRTVFVASPSGTQGTPSNASRADAPAAGDGPARMRLSWPARDKIRGRRFSEDADTRDFGGPREATPSRIDDDEKTRLFAAPAAGSSAAPAGSSVEGTGSSQARVCDDPVVGWIVVVEGPGKGFSIEIGNGANAIGRDKSQKLKLDFGDAQVSREKHALIIYEPRSRKFYLQSGDVRNLTYLNNAVVLSPTELVGGEIITVGQTKVQFVPFCGPEFAWD